MTELTDQAIVWEPSPEQVAGSNLAAFMQAHGIADHAALLARASEDPDWWWTAIAAEVRFMQPFSKVLDTARGIEFPEWFRGATTNIVDNALDRHRDTETWTAPAILGEGEDGTSRVWSYADLSAEVARLAAGLHSLGVARGEVVAVYMPNVNEAIAALGVLRGPASGPFSWEK